MAGALLLGLLCGPAAAQPAPVPSQAGTGSSHAGAVSGTVLDSSGAAIAGATVVLTGSTGDRSAVTDSSGRFVFQDVAPGALTVTVTFAQFASARVSLPGLRSGVRIVLQPVPVTEALTVRAPAATALRVVSATRTERPLRDVPQSVSVVTRDLISDRMMMSMADVVEHVPGVGMAQGEGHRDAPIFRGNTSTADFLVNGVRDDTQYLRDLYNVERVEVLKGPNGMIFGRGGAGGVINRVTRQADWSPSHELTLQGGAWSHKRLTADLGQQVNLSTALRLTGLYENSGTFREGVDVERYGINPTTAFVLGPNTTLRAGYEFFRDERTTDRGVPSFQGSPLDADPSTFFGSTDVNRARIVVNTASTSLAHTFTDRLRLRNHLRYADYDKFYQNLVPVAVNAPRTAVSLTAYNTSTQRQNLFNQTDLVWTPITGRFEHTLSAGLEVGRQVTDNRRMTGFFNSIGPDVTSIAVPLDSPTTSLPVAFRPSAGDATNHGVATVAAVYAQDEIALSSNVQAIVGLRYDRFSVDLLDRRNGAEFTSSDALLSPRLAAIYKPRPPVSLYASHTRAYLPRAGEQLSSLSPSNQALDPENFRNYEAGVKWEIGNALSFTTAVYQLDHGNVVVRDAVDPTLSHLVDAERIRGLELELTGNLTDRWSVRAGYAFQDGEITQSISSAVRAGARLAQVPRHSFSLWNRYHISTRWSVGLGIVSRSDSFVATDNTVVLPGFTRVDGALFYTITENLRAHIDLENISDERYYWGAHNNNNIAPGSPRALRVSFATRF